MINSAITASLFLLKFEQKKEAHSEDVPIPTPTTALQHTQARDVPCYYQAWTFRF